VSSVDATPPRLAVILGRADEMRAVVYLRMLDGEVSLAGTLRGPRCRHAATLQTTASLRMLPPPEAGAVGAAIAEVILVEPGFWSPELPNRYELELCLTDRSGRTTNHSQMVGVCRLGHRNGAFRLDGRRYVPRAITLGDGHRLQAAEAAAVVVKARDASVALWTETPSEAVCEAADAEGVLLIADLPAELTGEQAGREVARLAVHPSVGFVAVKPSHLGSVVAWRSVRGTMQLGLQLDGGIAPPSAATPADCPEGIDFLVVVVPEAGFPHETWRRPAPLPVVIRRPLPRGAGGVTMQEQRRGCERLQADMAAWLAGTATRPWEPAGYAV